MLLWYWIVPTITVVILEKTVRYRTFNISNQPHASQTLFAEQSWDTIQSQVPCSSRKTSQLASAWCYGFFVLMGGTWTEDFNSFHEMRIYDLPAQVDYILNFTQKDKLICQVYSLGTSMSFVFLFERPEYNEKVKLLVAEAPVARLDKDSGSLVTSPAALVSLIYATVHWGLGRASRQLVSRPLVHRQRL